MTKLLIVLLEQLRSILYQFMVKIKIPENWAEKPPPPHLQEQGNFFRLDLSISCNFQQLLFRWQKSPHSLPPSLALSPFLTPSLPPSPSLPPPPPRNREIFLDWIYPFHAISQQLWFQVAEKPPSFLPFHQ